jgi:hypothetical protein
LQQMANWPVRCGIETVGMQWGPAGLRCTTFCRNGECGYLS